MNKFHDILNERDGELAEAVCHALETKAEQHDPLLDASLAAARRRALEGKQGSHQRRWWMAGGLGFALAAGLAVMTILPHNALLPTPEAPAAEVAAMPDADLQLLESMDMLVAMQ